MTDHSTLRVALLAAIPVTDESIVDPAIFERLRRHWTNLSQGSHANTRDSLIVEGMAAKWLRKRFPIELKAKRTS
ncbi:hypothetical protein [Pseudomonas sp. PIC25]|uniref:hypothetical protein n=1 Tax=Pseudomonas sp. PIC25 TaxID=1958773 RepID=UPI00143DF584|nr:hypothetical protein [Pseudomonas sp. PIC25]